MADADILANEHARVAAVRRRACRAALLLAPILLYVFVFVKNAWICDDAYIVMRSVEQTFAGHGPRWNPHERVQAFTSPLWFGALCLVRPLTSDAFILTGLVSALCCAGLLAALWLTCCSPLMTAFAVGMLVCSNSYFDFTTSGLENPLCAVLLMTFWYGYTRAHFITSEPQASRRWLHLALYAGGVSLVCRHDLVTLVGLPAMLVMYRLYRLDGFRRTLTHVMLSIAPLAAWSLFASLYYGSPLPNTYLAKLRSGVPAWEMVQRGLQYLATTGQFDPVLPVVVLAAGAVAIASRRIDGLVLAAAIAANLGYCVLAGGDFMAGRFVTGAYLGAVVLLCVYLPVVWRRHVPDSAPSAVVLVPCALALVIYALGYSHTPVNSPFDYTNKQIVGDVADERGFYFSESSAWAYAQRRRGQLFPVSRLSEAGCALATSGRNYVAALRIGAYAYWAGTDISVIDPLALADPFLSRLAIPDTAHWRAGHFRRDIPAGYIESLRTGRPSLADPSLGELYQKVVLVTQSPRLLSLERLKAIVELNLPCGTARQQSRSVAE